MKHLTCKAAVYILLLAVAAGTAKTKAYVMMGSVKSMDPSGHNVTFACENGVVKLSFLTESIVRVHMSPDGVFPADDLHLDENGPYAVVNYSWPGVSPEITEGFDYDLEGEVYTVSAGSLVVKVRKKPFKLAFHDASGKLLVMEKPGIVDAGLGHEGSKVYETMHLPDDEHFFGFGAHNHPLDMRGHSIKCTTTELQSKEASGGFPIPFFMSTKGYGIFFNNLDDDVTFEMGTSEEEYSFGGTSGRMEGWDMDYYLIHGPAFEEIIGRYASIVGKPMLPVKWLFGHIQCRCCDWDQKDILEVARKYREGHWPCDVLIIDFQWSEEGYHWSADFPDPGGMYKKLNRLGYKTGLISTLSVPFYDWPSYDPTVKEDCRRHFAEHVRLQIDGNSLWWQDNSESYYKFSGKKTFANGYEARELFGSLWSKNIVEGLESLGQYGRGVISRSGPIGGHRYIIPFAGDLAHGLDFLPTDLNWLRNGNLSLYPFLLVELGGFIHRGKPTMDPLEEHNVIRRMINMFLVVPISRAHGAKERGELLPWDLTASQQELYRYYLRLRYRLHPYIYSAAIESHQTGRPLLASLVFDYQEDRKTYDKDYQFMLGRQILVAPVLEKVDEWKVYLPKGKWVHYWTGAEYSGPQSVTVEAPLYGRDGLPMFVKSGAIIPMMPQMSYIYEKPPDPITLDIYPLENGRSRYVLYDCETVKSPVTKTVFECIRDDGRIAVAISPSDVGYELVVHYDKEPAGVVVDSQPLRNVKFKPAYDGASEGWYYGSGCFYGSEKVKTVNIRIARGAGRRIIEVRE